MGEEDFSENVDPTAAIRAILGGYPFSIGLLREILQNSDDARATKQVFRLDRRYHGTKTIYNPYLAATQGPALLAYNDGMIKEEDWEALQNIHRSSKNFDSSKIGKYGIGFRSCYHITDNPHILSGSHLAILDTKYDFAAGGVRVNIERDSEEYRDHLAAFGSFLPRNEWGKHFNGTVFRFPLRTSPGDISSKTITPNEISGLLKDFALEELNVSLLFLRNISSVEIYEIGTNGKETCIATSTIRRAPPQSYGQYEIQKVTVETRRRGGESEEQEWRVLHAPFSESEAIKVLSQRLGCNPSTTLSQHKLTPTIDLAIPLGAEDSTRIGRLFTFLPLPLRTGFPVHINALFSLTQSRQNLRNGGEVGIVKNSDDHALIEWNRMLFDAYIPQAWAHLLEVLVKEDQVGNIFDAWPRLQGDIDSGDYVYWKDMPQQVMKYALDLCVWPISGTSPCMHESAGNLIFAMKSTSNQDLAALIRAGLLIVRAPEYLTDVIGRHYMAQVAVLSPQIAHSRLLDHHNKLLVLDDSDVQIILSYLLSTKICDCIMGLPLIPLVSQSRTSLKKYSIQTPRLCLFDEVLEDLFTRFDSNAVSLKRLPPDVRDILVEQGCRDLNLAPVQVSQVIIYLKASPYVSGIRQMTPADGINWLNKFWDWVQAWKDGSVLYDRLSPFYLIPVTKGLQTLVAPVFDPTGDDTLAEVLEVLAVPLIDSRLSTTARTALKELKPVSDVHVILRALPPSIDVSLTEGQAQYLSSYLIKALPPACAVRGSLQNDAFLRSRLRALPIYPVITLSAGGVPSTSRMSIDDTSVVRGVDLSIISVLPQRNSLVYLNLQLIDRDILQYLDPNHQQPITLDEAQNATLDSFTEQSFEMQVAFVKYLDKNSSITPRGILDRLANEQFVPAKDGSLQAPKGLIDPNTPLAPLYPGASSSLPDLSRPVVGQLVSHLRTLKLLTTHLSIDIVRERVRFIADSPHPVSENVACALIALINSSRLDCRRLFDSSHLSTEVEWIPTPEGLKSPRQCRDRSSHSGKTYLFDEIVLLVKPGLHIGPNLQSAFKWEERVPVEIISQQLVRVLDRDDVSHEKVRKILEELANRRLTRAQLFPIQQLLKSREWLPTRNGSLSSTSRALLGSQELPALDFHSVAFSWSPHGRMLPFLRRVGCRYEPSKETILECLEVLHTSGQGRVQNPAVIQGIIRLLEWLSTLSSTERLRLFIPDIDGVLRGFYSVCYNDLGERAYLVDIGDRILVHPEINENLAHQLGLQRLGLLIHAGSDVDPGLDMGEDLMTTIRNRLREYTHSQLLLEFLANASDAGATEFNVLLDEKKSPAGSLLSLRSAPFQSVPAFVIHNNSVFTDDDFNGILRTGVGGKTGRQDTIGQFGLGALTMFHVTEFAMIVSGDQVLFLNPCKAHLPLGRASLRLSLARMRKLYSDHLSPLFGLFGFSVPEDPNEPYFYNGTLFRLPLRSKAQVEAETISKTVVSFSDVVSHFKSVAPKCLLFTNISNIKLLERKGHQSRPLWSIVAKRRDSTQINGVDAHTVSISGTAGVFQAQDWRIMSFSAQEQPPSFTDSLRQKYRLRMPPIIRIAACLSSVDAEHDLFSTLPLPISLELPVHISASFILASDRRSMRLDEYENVETSYNRWLLTTAVPQLYLRFLEDRAAVSDNASYWPGNSAPEESRKYSMVSTLVMDAVYQMATVSDAPIFRSHSHNRALSFREAHLSSLFDHPACKALDAIKPQDLVVLPSSVTDRLQSASTDDGHISIIQPKYIQTQILDNDSNFDPSTLKPEELQILIDYLMDNDLDSLLGLRLLPLEDGTITRFTHSSESCFFVPPSEVLDRSVFKTRRLVHRGLKTTKLLGSEQLNVKKISDTNIGELLNDYLSESPTLENASPETCSWIERFWKAFKHLQITPSAITKYPLVPTLQAGVYVSISHCVSPSVVLADFTGKEWLSRCFAQMGFFTVNIFSLVLEVQSCMERSPLDVESVSSTLFSHPTRSLEDFFASLDPKSHAELADWLRTQLAGRGESYFLDRPRLKLLPIWKTVKGSYMSAQEVQMLPSNISLEAAAPFSSGNVSGYNQSLLGMGIQPHSSVLSLLQLPKELEPQKDEAYERLIQALMSLDDLGSLPVPDLDRFITESNTLYSSQDALFLAAFGPDSNYFVLPSFRHLEGGLDRYGLKRQRNLSVSMFKECVEAFQAAFANNTDDEEDEGFRHRAVTIFQVFAEELPQRGLLMEEWKELDNLRFVPRDMDPKPLGKDISIEDYVASWVADADVVSPSELVRPEFSAIAWSQRALYNAGAQLRVFTANPELSVPTAEEVVNHLVVLATKVARHHPRNELVLSHLKQTYKWLNENSEEAQPFLDRYRQKTTLFLNVNNPETDDWSWVPGSRVWFETYDAEPYFYARTFLESFRKLLIAAGAININHPDLELVDQAQEEKHLMTMCRRFDGMRRDGKCTDTHFIFKGEVPLRAHRSYLAAYSSYFRDMFSSSSSEACAASAIGPIQLPVPEWSRRCIELVLDYAYTGMEPNLSSEDVDLALEALRLMHLWSISEGNKAVQNLVMKLKMVTLSNVGQVQVTAKQTKATVLLAYCDTFMKTNDPAIRGLRQHQDQMATTGYDV